MCFKKKKGAHNAPNSAAGSRAPAVVPRRPGPGPRAAPPRKQSERSRLPPGPARPLPGLAASPPTRRYLPGLRLGLSLGRKPNLRDDYWLARCTQAGCASVHADRTCSQRKGRDRKAGPSTSRLQGRWAWSMLSPLLTTVFEGQGRCPSRHNFYHLVFFPLESVTFQ